MEISKYFRIRCSAAYSILTNIKEPGLTDSQKAELQSLQECKAGKLLTPSGKAATFTPKREERLNELEHLRDNPAPDVLPSGAKTYCDKWLQDFIYSRSSGFSSKETEKGTRTEDDGIELLREYLQDPFLPKKNEWRVVGEYIEGECDIRYNPVWDIKSAFTHATVPLWDTEPIPTNRYQLQGYCYLFGADRAGVAKVLVNMPEDMIEKEAYYATKGKYGPEYTEEQLDAVRERLTRKYTYDDLPIELRVHTITFDRDPQFMEHVTRRVKMCREYIDQKFNELPEEKRAAAIKYVTHRINRRHEADVKRTEANAKAWREINQSETAQSEVI